jgi:hypothetical protein
VLGKARERTRLASSQTAQTIVTINMSPAITGGGTSKATMLISIMMSMTCANHFT